MTKRNFFIYVIFCFLSFTGSGCADFDHGLSQTKGKFVFMSNRLGQFDIFICEKGKTRLLLQKASNPAWSLDGGLIACSYSDEISKKPLLLILDANGKKKKIIEMPEGQASPCNINWSPDGTKIYYVPHSAGSSGYKNKVYCYDFLSKTHKKIIEIYETFNILELTLSPEGDMLLVSYLSIKSREMGTYLFKSDGTGIKILEDYKGHNGVWYPDNEHILYATNLKKDGSLYLEKGHGYFFKMNIYTGETVKLSSYDFMMLYIKMSRDGKYIYYVAGSPTGGRVIYVSPMNNLGKKIQITYPEIMPPPLQKPSQDSNPDWYQGE